MAPLGVLFISIICAEFFTTGDGRDLSLGTCWRIRDRSSGFLCGKPLRSGVTRQRCCSGHFKRAWNTFLPREVLYTNTSELRRAASKEWVLKNRNSVVAPTSQICLPCASSCQEVKCGENEVCVMKRGLPKCVCSPQCHLQHKAPVCGTDGRTYRSECHLLKRSCRKRRKIKIAHGGRCQTCLGVKCGGQKACVLDDLLNAKCMRCPTSCEKNARKKPFCGSDSVTYTSKCQTRIASCETGKLVKRVYRGPCKKNVSCDSVRCWRHETCLTDSLGQPHCWKCGDYHKCPQTPRHICGSDGTVYQSWCEFRLAACRSGRALEAEALHLCVKKKKNKTRNAHECSHTQTLSEEVNNLIEEKKSAKTRKQKKRKDSLLKKREKRRRKKKDRKKTGCKKTQKKTQKTE